MDTWTLTGFGKTLVLAFIFTLTIPAFAQPPQSMVLYLPTVNTPVKDFSGRKNNATSSSLVISNSPSLVSMQQTHQLTIALWIKPNSIPSEFPVLVSKGGNNPGGAYDGYELVLNSNGDIMIFVLRAEVMN